ncbi:Transcriptional regulator GlxA family, contains an amidase domain and an AraC-type DNA-binding HTH domain [Saccharopolyspora shandongensis]|uniref:Transcriptional regulator GlxA family, contains an amidase domain and an AraC-type DNA-binding HTH domain n=1 Tax=Saccharopolyspora shandongensis TaxID=418495 RepID=A0A1H3DDZ3_9PSEU|nr:DJ-1/PfpI family protein [Saccharopolyspora shandongensis]SDX63899.1 Transcriptional regulator GlxA family, contains an amidase domain and an AraC-type DNA-binding HTH domain [Saccharopolyspora shandongensis]
MTHRVAVVVFDGVTMLDVSGPSEVLHQAGRLGHPYELVLVSPRGAQVATSAGLGLAGTVAAADAGAVDTVVVAGGDRLAEQRPEDDLLAAVRTLAAQAKRVASVCTGAFALAELGLLDGRRATTHWRHAEALARRYPRVRVEPDAIHIRDGRYVTSAGISAGIDLTLALVEDDHGAGVARDIAREMVVFLQRPGGQSQFSTALATPPARSDVLRSVIASVVADPAADHSLPAMAVAAAVSTRHLTRLFSAELGTTPARWVERVRLDRAQQLLLDGHSVTSAARHSGLGTDESLRRAFARHLGTTPTHYRRRFATTHRHRDAPGQSGFSASHNANPDPG